MFSPAFASFIKDPSTVAARASCYLEAQRRLAITGTPIQNKLDDLWALIKFIRLDPFDDRSVWQEFITTPAKSGNSLGLARLLIIMRHITLRRTKETRLASGKTLLDLPERQDEVRFLRFTEKEQAIYDKYFQDSAKDFNEMIVGKEDGPDAARTNTSYVNILQKILRLRQICDHYLLMTDSSSAAADEDDSSEPLDYEAASAAIAMHGLTKKRAVSVLAWMKEEAMCECVECKAPMDDLATSLAGLSVSAGEEEAVVKKKGKSKKPFVGILTKCQHLFCELALLSFAFRMSALMLCSSVAVFQVSRASSDRSTLVGPSPSTASVDLARSARLGFDSRLTASSSYRQATMGPARARPPSRPRLENLATSASLERAKTSSRRPRSTTLWRSCSVTRKRIASPRTSRATGTGCRVSARRASSRRSTRTRR